MNDEINNQLSQGDAEELVTGQEFAQDEPAAAQDSTTEENITEEKTVDETAGTESAPDQESHASLDGQETREPQIPQGVYELFKKADEKKDIKKKATTIGVPSLILMAIGSLWSSVFFFVASKLGFGYEEALSFASTAVMGQVFQIILSILMFTVPFIAAVKIAGYNVGEIGYFGKPREKTALPYFLFGVGFCAFANISIAYASAIFEGFGIEYEVDFGDEPRGFFGFLLTVIATAVVPALVEEFACRGIMIGLLKKYGEAFAVIATAILFGVMHGNFEQIPFAFLVGLVLGFVYVKTRSIWVCVGVHFINNFISVLFSYMPQNMDMGIQNVLYTVYLIAAMLVAVVGVVLISSKQGESFELEKSDTASSEKEKYKWFFTNVLIIIFIVLNLIEAVGYFL